MEIRKARKAANLTQDDLAKKIGINRATLSKYENGQIEPLPSQLRKIADALNVPVSILWGLPAEHEASVSAALEAIEAYQSGKLQLLSQEEFAQVAESLKRQHEEEQQRFTESPEGQSIISAYYMLNAFGQSEAVKRIQEMTRLDEYKRADGVHDDG